MKGSSQMPMFIHSTSKTMPSQYMNSVNGFDSSKTVNGQGKSCRLPSI